VVCAEQQLLNRASVVGRAFHGLVRAWADALQHGSLCLAHGAHHRQLASVVKVNADAEVDFVSPRVFAESFIQGEDGVACVGVDVFEHIQARDQADNARSMSARMDSGVSVGA
jgi:hypothetical protein